MKKQMMLPIRDFIEAADIHGNFLYRKDGYILSYLRIFPYNFNLLSHEEQEAETEKLSARFQDDRKDFMYCAFPREIDLDDYKNFLKEKDQREMEKIGRRHIISIMMKQANYLSINGNYEHQHFIRIWKFSNDQAKAEEELLTRITEFKIRYEESGIQTEILDEKELLKLCNLFGNSTQANFEVQEDNAIYSPVMQLN